MPDPFKEREVRLTVLTRQSGSHSFTVEETVAKIVMMEKIKDEVNLFFYHSGGVAFFLAEDVVSVQMHGTSMAHSSQLLTEVRELLK